MEDNGGEYTPAVNDEVSYFNGESGQGEDATIAALGEDGFTATLTIDADSRTESDVPMKQGNFNPLRHYEQREVVIDPPLG